jgi:alkylation response protein AidB-like acyl-CoA dehydrogenase
MDFSFEEDQLALREATRRFCDGQLAPEHQGKRMDTEVSGRHWEGLAHLGLLGLPLASKYGGSSLGAVDMMIVAEELGRCLATPQYFSHIVLAAQLLQATKQTPQTSDWLERTAKGKFKAVLALFEAEARHDWHHVKTRVEILESGYLLNGRKFLVLEAETSDLLLVLARTSGDDDERSGLSLFAVSRDAPGVELVSYDTMDGRRATNLEFKQVKLTVDRLVGEMGDAYSLVEKVLQKGHAFLCAETVGVMDALLDQCIEHLRTRQQFGSPLAKFQVLQHQVADMVIALEQLRSMACASAMALESGDIQQIRRIVSAARVLSAQWGRQAALLAIQMHGAMGVTEELRLTRFAKRLIALSQLHGDARVHSQNFIDSA